MAGLEETLALDYSDALSGVDELESRLARAAGSAEDAFSEAFSSALDEAQAMADLAGDALSSALREAVKDISGEEVEVAVAVADVEAPDLTIDADVSALEDAQALLDEVLAGGTVDLEVEDLDGALPDDVEVRVEVDTEDVAAAASEVEGLGGEAEVTVTVETSEVQDAAATIDTLNRDAQVDVQVNADGLEDAQTQAEALGDSLVAVSESANVSGGSLSEASSGASEYGSAAQDAGVANDALGEALGGVTDALGEVAPGFSAATVGAAALGATVGFAVSEAITAESSALRLSRAYGTSAGTVSEYDDELTGVVGTLEELSVATGSSDDDLKFLLARFGETGQALGFTQEQTAEAGAKFAQLAFFVAATRPELGSAEVVAQRLSRALAAGGRFAAEMGVPLANAAEIAEFASEKFGKPVKALSQYEKQLAGLELATQRLGPAIGAGIAAATDDPIVKLRSLQTAIGEAIEAAGQPLVAPFVTALERAEPIIEDVISVVGDLGSGAVVPLAATVGGLTSILGVLADTLERIPAPLLAVGGAFLVARKEASLILGLVGRVTTGLSTLSTRLGAVGTAARFSGITAQFGGLEKAVSAVAARQVVATKANEAFLASLAAQVPTNAAAAGAIRAHTAAMQADAAVTQAQIALGRANAEVDAAEAEAATLAAGSEARLATAREAQTKAVADLAAAEAIAANARRQSTIETERAIAATTTDAAATELNTLADKAQTASEATKAAGQNVATAGAAAGGAAALVGPLGLVLGVAAAAWFLVSDGARKSAEALKEGKDELEQYADSLGLTNEQLASLDSRDAAAQFQNAAQAAEDFYEALGTKLQDDFARLGLDAGKAGSAIRGSTKDVKAFRQSLIDSGDVEFFSATDNQEDLEEARRVYVETGKAVIDTDKGISASKGRVAQVFEEQLAAQEELNDALVTEAEVELAAAEGRDSATDALDVSAIRTLVATGAIDQLSDAQEAAARAALAQADATEANAIAQTQFAAAAAGAEGAQQRLIEGAQRAADAFANGEAINTSDLGAARALAASDAFEALPKEVQDSVNALLDFADAEVDAADDANQLITSLGEVASSVIDLRDELDLAIDKFDELRGAEARYNAGARDIASGIRGVDDQVRELGSSLDDQGAKFDAAAITAANYTDYLGLLSDEQRKAIEDAKVPDGTDKDGTPKERDLTDEEAAARVRDAIVGSAEAMGRANDEAKDNADSLLDYFDTVTGKIAEEGEAAIARGESVADVNARVADQVRQFRDAAIAAGVAEGAVDEYLSTVGLNPVTGFSAEQLDSSGVTIAADNLRKLQAVIGLLPKETQIAINAETDPEEQRKLIEESLQQLGPEFAVAVDTYLAATTPEEEQAALDLIQQGINRLQIVKVALGLEVDPSADQGTQIQQIQDQIGDKTEGAQIAIRTFLQAPDEADAQFALDTIANRLNAARQVVAVFPTITEEAAAQAVLDITTFNNNPDNQIKLPVTVETAGLVAQVNAGYENQLEAINVRTDISEEDKEELRNELERQRTAELTIIAETGQASAEVDSLTAQAQTQEVKVDIQVPEWAKWIVGYPGAKPPATVGVQVNPTTGGGSGAGKPTRGPAARLIENVGGFFSGLFGRRGGTTMPQVEQYAAGGARVDPRILRRLSEMDGGLDEVGAPDSGFYGPGKYVTFAEDGTAGEYLISRSITDRARNQNLVRTAAADLGVPLTAPSVTVSAPPAVLPPAPTDTGLTAALERLTDTLPAAAGPRRTVTLEAGAIVVQDRSGDSARTAAHTADEFYSESFLRGDLG